MAPVCWGIVSQPESVRPETSAAQAMGFLDRETAAVVPPIHPSTTYERGGDNKLLSGRLYSRADNPNYDLPEAILTHLECGSASAVFSSGMSAATAVLMALRPGDHVLVPKVIYWAFRAWLLGWATDWGLRIESVDMTDPAKVAAAIQPGKTKLPNWRPQMASTRMALPGQFPRIAFPSAPCLRTVNSPSCHSCS